MKKRATIYRRSTEEQIDAMAVAEAGVDSAWGAHVVVKRPVATPVRLSARAVELGKTGDGAVLPELIGLLADGSGEVRSLRLGLAGKADVVEFHRVGTKEAGAPLPNMEGYWLPFPVEHKRGRPKTDLCDEIQLCAQALCLEEMLAVHIPAGALFYGTPRRRSEVTFDAVLRREQYRRADDAEGAVAVARAVVLGKITNCRTVLQRAVRDHGDKIQTAAVDTAVRRLGFLIEEVAAPLSIETLRAKEGEAAKAYFGVFDHLVTAQKEDFFFRERSRRPPLDSLNALLSFLYTLLVHDATGAIETAGLDPQVGFLHALRPWPWT